MVLAGKDLRDKIDEYVAFGALSEQSPRTIENKRNLYRRLVAWLGHQELSPTTTLHYISYLRDRCKPNSVRTEVTNIRAFVNWLERQGYIEKSWADKLPRPKRTYRPDFVYIDPEIVEKVIIAGTEPTKFVRRGLPGDNARNVAIKKETRAALLFALKHGLRIGEVIRLTGADLNLFDNPPSFRVAPSKGHNEELMNLALDMIPELEKRKGNGRLFAVTADTCNVALKRGCAKVGVTTEVRNHILRHIFITNLIKRGTPLSHVKRLARHTSIETTDRNYTHLNITDLSIALNSAQPKARALMSWKDKADYYERAIRALGAELDPSVTFEMVKSDTEFYFKIRQR